MLFVDFLSKVLNKKLGKNLLTKLTIIFLLLSGLTVFSAIYMINLVYLQNTKNSAFDKLASIRSEKELQIQKLLFLSQEEAYRIVNTPDVRQKTLSLTKGNLDELNNIRITISLRKILKTFIDKSSKIDSIFVLDNNDKILASMDSQPDNANRILYGSFDKPYKPLAKPESANILNTIVQNSNNPSFYLSVKDRKPILVFISPIFDEIGNQTNNILVNIKFDLVNKFIVESSNVDNKVDTYLVGKLNNKIFLISNELQELKIDANTHADLGINRALKGELGREEYTNYVGKEVLGSSSWIEKLNIALISEVEKANTFESSDRIFRNLTFAAIGIIILMAFVFYRFIRSQIQPMSLITDMAISIADGNLEAKFPITQKNEFDTLAIALNQILNKFRSLNHQVLDAQYIFSQQANQSTEVIQNFIELTSEGFAFLDRRDTVLQINSNLAEILSISTKEAIGNHYEQIFPIEITNLINSMRSQNKEVAFTEFLIPHDRSTYKATISNIFCKSSNSLEKNHFLGTIILVHESDKAIELPHFLVQDRVSVNTNNYMEKPNYIDDISLKVRTPLTALLGFLKLTQSKLEDVVFPRLSDVDDKTQRTVQQIQDNLEFTISEGTRIAKLLGAFLQDRDTSHKSLSNNLPPQPSKFFASELLSQVNREATALFLRQNSSLIFDIDISSAEIEGDREEIKYVFTNLLTRIANFDELSVAIMHARLVKDRLIVIIGKVNSLVDRDRFLFIANNLHNSISKTDLRNPLPKGMGLKILQEILQKYSGSISVELVDIHRDRYKFYVLTLPAKL
ncbi:MAG: hypothetical protein DCF19_14675 [Pseudanabaena frigida]|uniref:histidine kinase n=1 Tax=Pseudanabaena frigida TaxID=945775 RepID=A0A2W4W418_9CYAN|nr:MAG: hypothetical protein DCF19_14675 [Pseudanabaena frigida]